MATGQLIDLAASDVDLGLPAETPWDSADRAVSVAGGAAAVTVTADADRPIVISQIHCGYDAAPAAGSTLKIEDVSGTTVWQVPIVSAGPYEFTLEPNKCSAAKNTALIVTLSAGGGAVLAYLNLNVRRHR